MPPRHAKPTLSELIKSSREFETMSIHIASPGGPHAIVSFDARAIAEWACKVRELFPHMEEREAFFRLVDAEIRSERMRLAINAAHMFSEPDPTDTEGLSQGFFAPEPEKPWAVRLKKINPDSIGNPSFRDNAAVLHLELVGDKLPHPHLSFGPTPKQITAMMVNLMSPPVFDAMACALDLSRLLLAQLGPAAIMAAPGWSAAGTTLAQTGAISYSFAPRDLAVFREEPGFQSALQSATEQAILRMDLVRDIPASPSLSNSPRL